MKTNIKCILVTFGMALGQLLNAQILPSGLRIQQIESRSLYSPRAAVMTADGNFVAVAVNKGLPMEHPSLVFLLLDQTGEVLQRYSHPVSGLKEIISAIPAFDGGFVVSGSMNDNSGWLAKLNEKGGILASYQENKVTQFPAVTQLPDGSFLAIGNDGKNSYLFLMNLEADQKSGKRRWEKKERYETLVNLTATSICRGKDNHYGITGYSSSGGNQKLAFSTIQVSNGSVKINRAFLSNAGPELKKGNSIIYDHFDDSYVIVGELQEKNRHDTDGFWGKFTSNGDLKKYEKLGRRSNNESLTSLILLGDEGFLLAGSYEYNRTNQPWLLAIDSLGNVQEEQRLTSTLDQQIHHVFSTLDQKLVAVAHSSAAFGWFNISDVKVFEPPSGQLPFSIDTSYWMEEVKDDTLKAGERSYFMIRVNNSSAIRGRIRAIVRFRNQPFDLFSYSRIYAECLPGEQTWLAVPFVGGALLTSDTLDATVSLFDPGGNYFGYRHFGVRTKAVPVPVIKIVPATAKFKAGGKELGPEDRLNRLDTITMQIEVKNIGEVAAKNVRVNLKLPYNTKLYENPLSEVDSIQAGKSHIFSLDFLIHSYYEYDDIALHVFARESAIGSSDYAAFYRKVPDFFLISPPDTTPYIPRKIIETRERGGPAPQFIYPDPSDIKIDVTAPCERHKDEGLNIEVYTNRLNFSAKIYSPVKLEEKDVQVLIPEIAFDKKGKPNTIYRPAGENDEYLPCYTVLEEEYNKENGTYLYYFKTRLFLEKGGNPFVLGIKGNSVRSKLLKVEYRPPYRRLWVYVIGVPFNDGEPTVESAELISEIYTALVNIPVSLRKFFDSVKVITVKDEDKTKKNDIEAIIQGIKNQFKDKSFNDKIDGREVEDMILFYFATHGKIENNKYLLAFNVQEKEEKFYLQNSIDFNISVIEFLGNLPISKFFILETCFSGSGTQNSLDNQKIEIEKKYAFEILTASDSLAHYNDLPVLTSALIDCLKNESFGDGLVSSQELSECVLKEAQRILVSEFEIPEEKLQGFLPRLIRWNATDQELKDFIIFEKEDAVFKQKCPHEND